ncbi:MAG: glycogen debranching protein GlgX [Nocardioides sp.]
MSGNPWNWSDPSEVAPVWPGSHRRRGAVWSPEATNFAVWAPEATQVWVCLFEGPGGGGRETRHQLTEKTLGVWHGAIPGVAIGQHYGFRADGPWEPALGRRFNPAKLLLDPYARAIAGETRSGIESLDYVPASGAGPADLATLARSEIDSAPFVPRSVVVGDEFDWGDDQPLRHRWRDTVVYELHVKGYTKLHQEIPDYQRGSYAGLGSPAVTNYLNDLGVTAVELLPVQHFLSEPGVLDRGLVNYWGYNSIGYFAPYAGYSSTGHNGEQVTEFKQMVKDLHAAGIEVILDVVYNHTAEGGPTGPTYGFRGLDDIGYYKRSGDSYWDVTGCGNTVDSTNAAALQLIADSLRYWVTEMHVDGFRFDLASALARTGHDLDMRSAFLTTINQDPVLREVKLIAEPWDASMDGYQVGCYPPLWVEWNDTYRDTMRDYWRSGGNLRGVASKLAGSSDLYADDGRSPFASVNFVTAHDGFTLRDLVSYQHKHNEANGEENRDGTDNNRSANYGVEGDTGDPEILAVRRRQAANLLTSLCLSTGLPMLTAGDERGRTQRGNNNAYCQDNEVSWMDWRPDDAWLDVYEVTKAALRLRREHPVLRQPTYFRGSSTIEGGPKDLAWIHPSGRELSEQDWADTAASAIGMLQSGSPLRAPGVYGEQQHDTSFLVWLNAGSPVTVTLPTGELFPKSYEVALSTSATLHIGAGFDAGEQFDLEAQAIAVLRQA